MPHARARHVQIAYQFNAYVADGGDLDVCYWSSAEELCPPYPADGWVPTDPNMLVSDFCQATCIKTGYGPCQSPPPPPPPPDPPSPPSPPSPPAPPPSTGTQTLMDGYELSWALDVGRGVVDFTVVARTLGWVGFGIAESGGMAGMPRFSPSVGVACGRAARTRWALPAQRTRPECDGRRACRAGADIMLATFDDRGAAEVGDYYALAHGRPTRDEQQDWQLVEASRDGSLTTIRFSRALDTSDRQDNPLFSVPGEPVRVIAAMGDSAAVEYHGTTGRSPARVDLFNDSDAAARLAALKADASVSQIEIFAGEYTIPNRCITSQEAWSGTPTTDTPARSFECFDPPTTYARFCYNIDAIAEGILAPPAFAQPCGRCRARTGTPSR